MYLTAVIVVVTFDKTFWSLYYIRCVYIFFVRCGVICWWFLARGQTWSL